MERAGAERFTSPPAAAAVVLRVGTRGSRLALTQAERAVEALRRPGVEIALVPITTAGDRDRSKPFGQIGERGVFVKELEEALLAGRVDVAVHSAKDMTSTDTEGLAVGAYPAREDPRDALCGASGLWPGMRVGTASVRRRSQLLALEPTLVVEPLRGNVDTRLRKRGERELDAIVLAACGLDRLGIAHEIGLRFDPEQLVPEAGQGALALQVRAGEEELVTVADDAETRRRVEAERRCTALIGGGCLAPVAAHHDGTALTALVADEDGAGSSGAPATTRRRWRANWRRSCRPRRAACPALPRGRERLGARSAHIRASVLATVPRPVGGWGVVGGRRARARVALRTVILTRPAGRNEALAEALQHRGFTVVVAPLVEVEPLETGPLDVTGYDWVVVTSATGARLLHERMRGRPSRVAAIGPATAGAWDGTVDLVPEVSTQEGLLAELPRPAGRVLFAGAEGARRLLVDELDADFVPLYRTRELRPDEPLAGRSGRARLAVGRARSRAARADRSCGRRSGPRRPGRPRPKECGCSPRRRARCGGPRRRRAACRAIASRACS